MSIYFTLIVESTENATWLLLERAYPIGGRLVHRLREDWLECMELWVRRHSLGMRNPQAAIYMATHSVDNR